MTRYAAIAAAILVAGSAAAQSEGAAFEEMRDKTRDLGIAMGNIYACADEDAARAQMRDDANFIFDLLLKDAGSDMAFVFAVNAGAGTAASADTLDCAALKETHSQILEEFGIEEAGQ
ncbi:MAG: hypothetical protein AAF698_01205 [Pseudomonadota bacterium]